MLFISQCLLALAIGGAAVYESVKLLGVILSRGARALAVGLLLADVTHRPPGMNSGAVKVR
jgi:hypothetical protein